jgi:hypothetical protein
MTYREVISQTRLPDIWSSAKTTLRLSEAHEETRIIVRSHDTSSFERKSRPQVRWERRVHRNPFG